MALRARQGCELMTVCAVTRGALNTPEALKEAAQGKEWDIEKREWVDTPSDAVAIDDPVYADARARYQKTRAEANGKTFPYYYEVLGVSVRVLAGFVLRVDPAMAPLLFGSL